MANTLTNPESEVDGAEIYRLLRGCLDRGELHVSGDFSIQQITIHSPPDDGPWHMERCRQSHADGVGAVTFARTFLRVPGARYVWLWLGECTRCRVLYWSRTGGDRSVPIGRRRHPMGEAELDKVCREAGAALFGTMGTMSAADLYKKLENEQPAEPQIYEEAGGAGRLYYRWHNGRSEACAKRSRYEAEAWYDCCICEGQFADYIAAGRLVPVKRIDPHQEARVVADRIKPGAKLNVLSSVSGEFSTWTVTMEETRGTTLPEIGDRPPAISNQQSAISTATAPDSIESLLARHPQTINRSPFAAGVALSMRSAIE